MCEYVMPRLGLVLIPTIKPNGVRDLEGYSREMLTVGRYLGMAKTQAMWEVFCRCGRTVPMSRTAILNPKIKSCGCYMRKRLTTHGMKGKRVYRIWLGIKGRCETPSNGNYGPYGGSGVKMHSEWSRSFESFLRDVGDCPTEEHTIDRFPNQSGNYEPGNVRWATPQEQGGNQKSNVLITIGDITRSASAWSAISGVRGKTITERIRSGWASERAVFTPPQKSGKSSGQEAL